MRSKMLLGVVAACALVCVQSAWAWNATGHEVVAAVAWDQLTPAVRAQVTELLKQHPDYARTLVKEAVPADKKDEDAFLVCATWPDLIRSSSFGKSNMYHRPFWHYADFPFVLGNVTPPPAPDVKWVAGTEPENAVQAYAKTLADLANTKLPAESRAIALCWVVHLVGDIHQPLHATSLYSNEYPTGDRGGNSEMIKVDGKVDNLHWVWDGLLGGFMDFGPVQNIAQKLEAAHPKAEFQKELAEPDFATWAHESEQQARKYAYLDGRLKTLPKDQMKDKSKKIPELPAGYMEAARATGGRDATLGGYRLAQVLNQVFGGEAVMVGRGAGAWQGK